MKLLCIRGTGDRQGNSRAARDTEALPALNFGINACSAGTSPEAPARECRLRFVKRAAPGRFSEQLFQRKPRRSGQKCTAQGKRIFIEIKTGVVPGMYLVCFPFGAGTEKGVTAGDLL